MKMGKTSLKTESEKTSNELMPEMEKLFKGENEKVCFICTGNTCRSPMAAAILNEYGAEYGIVADSAGILPQVGTPISENAVAAIEKAGIKSTSGNNYKNHKARQATEKFLSGYDKIVCMSKNHELLLIEKFPKLADKTVSFRSDISDPYGQSVSVYERCFNEIKEQIFEMFRLDD